MSFNRSRVQVRCEAIPNWDAKGFVNFSLGDLEAKIIMEDLREDSKDFYYKGALSACEAINAIQRRLFSWATIKLYYSVFYFLRATLASKGIAVLRQRGYYYLDVNSGGVPQKAPVKNNSSTHESACAIATKLLKASDILLSNEIDGKNAYVWLKEKRERVNYQEREFHEPGYPDFWEEIANQGDLDSLVANYLGDKDYIYCFQEEHACLALPLKRWELTRNDLVSCGIAPILTEDKKKILIDLLTLPPGKVMRAQVLLSVD